MAWFILARLFFTGAVAYTAFLLRPFGTEPLSNVLFGLGLAAVAVFFEWRLRDLALSNLLGAIIGGALGLLVAKGTAAALQDSRYLGHHRRPHRGSVRYRVYGWDARHSAVRAEGTSAGRRLRGLDEAQPRPPRAGHSAEGSEDVGS